MKMEFEAVDLVDHRYPWYYARIMVFIKLMYGLAWDCDILDFVRDSSVWTQHQLQTTGSGILYAYRMVDKNDCKSMYHCPKPQHKMNMLQKTTQALLKKTTYKNRTQEFNKNNEFVETYSFWFAH